LLWPGWWNQYLVRVLEDLRHRHASRRILDDRLRPHRERREIVPTYPLDLQILERCARDQLAELEHDRRSRDRDPRIQTLEGPGPIAKPPEPERLLHRIP